MNYYLKFQNFDFTFEIDFVKLLKINVLIPLAYQKTTLPV
jgi:hypothetical protein